MTPSVLEAVEVLQQSPDHRVLTRFIPDPVVYLGDVEGDTPTGCKTGVFVDVESTGLSTKTDKIIELSLVPFTYDPNGIIYDAGKGLSFFNDPGMPIPPESTEIHGITDDMVARHSIDVAAVEQLVNQVGIVIAHHADFDRKMIERAMPFFRDKYWGCSQLEVPWVDEFECRAAKLGIILSDACNQFSEGQHRALEDCHLAVSCLANAQANDRTALSYLLESARQSTCRVWAVDSPFKKKDVLKSRGYLWSPKDEGGRNTWYRDVRPEDVDEEVMFARDIGGATPDVVRFGGKDRYSIRVS